MAVFDVYMSWNMYMYVMVVSKLMINKHAFQFIEAPYVTFIDHSFLIGRSAFAGCHQFLVFDVGGQIKTNCKTDANTRNSGAKSRQRTQIRSCPDG